jgi:hypothetical protein
MESSNLIGNYTGVQYTYILYNILVKLKKKYLDLYSNTL